MVSSEEKCRLKYGSKEPLRYYTWSSWPTDEGRNLEWVPQLWGPKSTSDWESNVNGQFKARFQQGQVKAVIGFNE